ncbi:MAG: hypothetical protein AB7P14_27145 [Blastocatellales bacterium]
MIVSPWSRLSEFEQAILAPKLLGLREEICATDQLLESASERFNELVIEYGSAGEVNAQTTRENILTARNFIAHAGDSPIWRQVAEIKGFRRSYLELTVNDRNRFLDFLSRLDYVVNREPFWSIHRFDSARELTDYSHQPSLHFANDRADEDNYGPNYFFVHWDKASCWFRKSNWPIRRLPGAKQVEQLYAAIQHRFGCACPVTVNEHLQRR